MSERFAISDRANGWCYCDVCGAALNNRSAEESKKLAHDAKDCIRVLVERVEKLEAQ